MTRSFLSRFFLAALAVVLAHLPATASACSVCMGDANSNTGTATNAAIFLMLGCIGGVLSLLVTFGIVLMKRASAPLPPHQDLASSVSDASANS
jgi:hypothetical protein